jgi:hypothetical protein
MTKSVARLIVAKPKKNQNEAKGIMCKAERVISLISSNKLRARAR